MRPLVVALGLVAAACSCSAQYASTDEHDYVIVGGGTAGCALAARLCEAKPDQQFVLLERGQKRNADLEFLVRAVRNAFYAWEVRLHAPVCSICKSVSPLSKL